jgi:ubiquinone biosynthesis protein
MQTNKGILILGFPFLGIIGFMISAVLGIALVISILKHSNI